MFSAKNNLLWVMELRTVILESFEKCQQNEFYYAFNFTVGYSLYYIELQNLWKLVFLSSLHSIAFLYNIFVIWISLRNTDFCNFS